MVFSESAPEFSDSAAGWAQHRRQPVPQAWPGFHLPRKIAVTRQPACARCRQYFPAPRVFLPFRGERRTALLKCGQCFEMPRQYARRGFAHMANAQGKNKSVERNVAPLVNRIEKFDDTVFQRADFVARTGSVAPEIRWIVGVTRAQCKISSAGAPDPPPNNRQSAYCRALQYPAPDAIQNV